MTAAPEPEPLRAGATLRAAGLTGIAIAATRVVGAEPSAGVGHVPFLVGFGILLAALAATFPHLLRKFVAPKLPLATVWVLSIALGVLALFFIPAIVVLGSILITGRTM